MVTTTAMLNARQQRFERRKAAAEAIIPHGAYCYAQAGPPTLKTRPDGNRVYVLPTKVCPYWKHRSDKPKQTNGYCRFLKVGDFTAGARNTTLLWDQVKECGINYSDDIIDEAEPSGTSM